MFGRTRAYRRLSASVLTALLLTSGAITGPITASPMSGDAQIGADDARTRDGVVFFAADGLRQDLVRKYAAQGRMPTMLNFLQTGAVAGGGLLTQAPPNTGAGWFTLATGAWPGVHGSTNNTFHVNGAAFATSTSALGSPNSLQAETIAQAAERGGLKVAQIEWAGGRSGAINGPTVDFRTFLSGRGVATNFIGAHDDAAFVASFGLQFDHPAGFAGQAAFPAAEPTDAAGWTAVPVSYSTAKEMRLRVLDAGTDKYGLNAYIFDSTNDGSVNYDRVLLSPSRSGGAAVATLGRGQWADIKVKIAGGPLEGKTAGFLVKVEELTADLGRVRLFHTSVSRANATWSGWPASGGIRDFAEYLAVTFPTATAADFAVLEAGIVSEETYVEQGLYWEKAHHPILKYILERYQPDLLLAGYPVTDEFSHQFLGLVTPRLMNGQRNPAFDDAELDGVADGRVAAREAFIRSAYEGADRTLKLARSLMGSNPNTFVASDHGFAPQFLAIDASKVLVDAGLLSHPQPGNCRLAAGETRGRAKACWAGGTLQIYLNVAGRDPAGAGLTQIAADRIDATVAYLRSTFNGLRDNNDWTRDGAPESWRMIDRTYTKAEARYIPNGPGSTTNMAHPTRSGDLIVFAMPPYQWDAATPGSLVAPSHFFGQHGYVPDLRNLDAGVDMAATFIAGGRDIARTTVRARSIDLAPTLAYLLRVPVPQQSQGRVLLELFRTTSGVTPISILGLNDFHGQLDPTTLRIDNNNVSVGGAAVLGTLFDEDAAALPGRALLLAGGDNVGASPPNSALLEDMPAIDVENAWGLDATSYGNHEFDYGVDRLVRQQIRADFPFLGVNIVEEDTGETPWWVRRSTVFTVSGIRIGVIGAELQNTPELVSAGATEGLRFLPEAPAIRAESERLRKAGVRVQILLIHQGTNNGTNSIGATAATTWDGPIVEITRQLQSTTIDAVIAGHTHRVSNTMVGRILVVEGINAGATYSVLQLMVKDGDVQWLGGATRVATALGVRGRADVQAIVNAANAATATLRNQVIGRQASDILRDPTRLKESEMGNLVADAMRLKYPGVDAALTNSGGLRADFVCSPPSAREAPCEITWGEVFATLPFGNRTVIETLTGEQLRAALVNGFLPVCDSAFAGGTGRSPQVSGLKIEFTCDSEKKPVINGLWLVPGGTGTPVSIADSDTVRIVTNDFMFTGGDGYTALSGGTDVGQPGDALLDIVIDYIRAKSPIDPQVEGRIVRK